MSFSVACIAAVLLLGCEAATDYFQDFKEAREQNTPLCSDPPPVANSYRWSVPNGVEYQCVEGYDPPGVIKTVGCVNSVWEGQPPVCILDCGKPPVEVGASVTGVTSSAKNYVGGDPAEAHYECGEEYNQTVEDPKMTCQDDQGRWEETRVFCINPSSIPLSNDTNTPDSECSVVNLTPYDPPVTYIAETADADDEIVSVELYMELSLLGDANVSVSVSVTDLAGNVQRCGQVTLQFSDNTNVSCPAVKASSVVITLSAPGYRTAKLCSLTAWTKALEPLTTTDLTTLPNKCAPSVFDGYVSVSIDAATTWEVTSVRLGIGLESNVSSMVDMSVLISDNNVDSLNLSLCGLLPGVPVGNTKEFTITCETNAMFGSLPVGNTIWLTWVPGSNTTSLQATLCTHSLTGRIVQAPQPQPLEIMETATSSLDESCTQYTVTSGVGLTLMYPFAWTNETEAVELLLSMGTVDRALCE
ncbi:uncharacterized protein LOC118477907 [Aplysia californica]|uniref:Uncharacterized protein LOC118477907 n=1 Tax=Aplysia californica TaxID=6500 RepID=A0ABM1VVL5_APLCA|nr:uncharacterized protein LOC118477907 [Aplysia californica]